MGGFHSVDKVMDLLLNLSGNPINGRGLGTQSIVRDGKNRLHIILNYSKKDYFEFKTHDRIDRYD